MQGAEVRYDHHNDGDDNGDDDEGDESDVMMKEALTEIARC